MNKSHLKYTLLTFLLLLGISMNAQTWSFASFTANDIANLNADPDNWEHETGSNDRYKNTAAFSDITLTANGNEIETTKGLRFTAPKADALRLDISGKRIALNGAKSAIIIPGAKAGQTVTVKCMTSKSGEARGLNVSNLTPVSGAFNSTSTDNQVNAGTVAADGDVIMTATGGLYVYSVELSDGGDIPTPPVPTVGGSTYIRPDMHQAHLYLSNGDVHYLNTDDVRQLSFDGEKVTVELQNESATPIVYDTNISHIEFRKALDEKEEGVYTNATGKIEIIEARGWQESAYLKWNLLNGADSYNVYVKGGQFQDFTRIDNQLVRNYGTYGRADVLGLVPDIYTLKVVPVKDNAEIEGANEAASIEVTSFDRSGFAHKDWNGGVGAYNNDGSLKSGAKVLYITKDNFNTVTLDMTVSNKGAIETRTGLGDILIAKQKGYDTTPIAVRFIGQIDNADVDAAQLMTDQGGLLLKGNNTSIDFQVTLEGVGDDASLKGFGIGVVSGSGAEIRNLAVMLHGSSDDNMEIKGTQHIWVHNCDYFYGQKGGGDHDKGDGSLDAKDNCSYATFAYNHFIDSGKSILCGMKSESTDNLITYHHNWFDHSDSRQPRVRTSTVHVYNNYYDGVAKYGVGATMGSSIFVESNFFRGTKRPMMISLQGTDATGDGTFSSENGGMIKSFGNLFVGRTSKFSYITHLDNATDFDAYEASERNEIVPASFKTKAGGTSYNNFDTSDLMHEYTPDAVAEVPAIVTGYRRGAGRLNHGDLTVSFNNATDDEDYGRLAAIDAALSSYKCQFVGFFTNEKVDPKPNPDPDPTPNPDPTPEGKIVCNFLDKAPSNSMFTVSGNYSNSKGTATYDGETYGMCLKMESSTSVKFTLSKEMKMTLVFGDSETGSIKINGTKSISSASTLTADLPAGAVELTKADSRNLFLIVLE